MDTHMKEERNMSDTNKHWHGNAGSGLAGAIWFIGWLFTIGFLKLVWWQIIVGIVVWPYFMGAALTRLPA
jgi:hypothetical protein